MTRDEIISDLYNSKEITKILNKVQPSNIREELKQEMFLALCNLSDEKFWSLYNSKSVNGVPFYGIYNKNGNAGLRFWLVRCMLNMVYSTSMNQPFYRNFRVKFETFQDHSNIEETLTEEFENKEAKELLFNKLEDRRKELSWYENKLLDTWCELGMSSAKVSRETQIPYMSIIRTISVIKKKLTDES